MLPLSYALVKSHPEYWAQFGHYYLRRVLLIWNMSDLLPSDMDGKGSRNQVLWRLVEGAEHI